MNVPWAGKDMGNGDYIAAFHQVLVPIAYEFNPDLIIVSAGESNTCLINHCLIVTGHPWVDLQWTSSQNVTLQLGCASFAPRLASMVSFLRHQQSAHCNTAVGCLLTTPAFAYAFL